MPAGEDGGWDHQRILFLGRLTPFLLAGASSARGGIGRSQVYGGILIKSATLGGGTNTCGSLLSMAGTAAAVASTEEGVKTHKRLSTGTGVD